MKFEDYLVESELLTEAHFEHHAKHLGDRKVEHKYDFHGKKVGSTPAGHHIYAGHSSKVGSKHMELAVHIVHKDNGTILASHAPHSSHANNEKTHKAAIAHAKSTDHFWSDREPHKNFANHHNDHQVLKKASK